MAWVAVAVGGAALVGGVASYLGSQNAANAETKAANQANDTQWAMFNQEQQNLAPYKNNGINADAQLLGDMPNLTRQFTTQDFHTDPGYQFALNQGLMAMQNSAAARGLGHSIGTLQDLNNYAQGTADQQYQNAYQRFVNNQQQTYNMLSGVANMGEAAAAGTNNAAQNTANSVSQNLMGAGNAQAAADMNTANNITSLLGTGANTWMGYNMMNHMYGGQTNPGLASQNAANGEMINNQMSNLPTLTG